MEHENRPDGPCLCVAGRYYPVEDRLPNLNEQVEINKVVPFEQFLEEVVAVQAAVEKAEERGEEPKIILSPGTRLATAWLTIHRVDKQATLQSVGELDDTDMEWLEAKEDEESPPEPTDEIEETHEPSSETFVPPPENNGSDSTLAATGGLGVQ